MPTSLTLRRVPAVLLVLGTVAALVAVTVPASQAQGLPVCRPGGEVVTGGAPGSTESPLTHVCNIPDTAMISAEFAETGNFLYASSTDTLSVYSYEVVDGAPTNWLLESVVPIVNFENESMTYGERRDAGGAITDRFVIMAEDLVSAHPEGAHTGGHNVVIVDVTDPTDAHVRSTGEIPTSTHTVQCVSRLQCEYAYAVGEDGVFTIIDLTDLDDPKPVEGKEEVRVTGGRPERRVHLRVRPRLVVRRGRRGLAHRLGWHRRVRRQRAPGTTVLNQGDESSVTGPLNDFILHNAKRPFASAYDDDRAANEPNLAKGNVVLVTEEDYLNDGDEVDCSAAGLFETWYVPNLDGSDVPADAADAVPGTGSIRNLDAINPPLEQGLPAGGFCSAHWFDVHETGIVAEGFTRAGCT